VGSAAAAGENMALRIRIWKLESRDGDYVPIRIVSGDVTNDVTTITITEAATEYFIVLPSLSSTDRIAIHSPTNKACARAILDEFEIVSGYSEGHLEPSYIVDGRDVGDVTSYSIFDLPSVPVQCAVAAYGRRGAVSANSGVVPVDLSNPEKIPVLNAFPLSDLEDGLYAQNFDSLAAITATSGEKEWLNGTTLPYWQAFKQDDSVSTFKYNGGAANTGGLYALATNQSSSVRALGAYSTKDNEFSFGIAFTNDTGVTMKLSSVAYLAQQWGFKNDTNQTLSVSAQVVDRLDWTSAYDEGWTELGATQTDVYGEGTTHDTPVNAQVLFNPAPDASSVAPGQVLMLRWTIHSLKSGKPGMIGIDDLTVTFSRARSLVIHLL
ncbi:MAG: hypothetical protein IKO55_05820, partial [Kiritimatiellae bacterium]|nr:hypothetical protein [Kiritimatiellia bacterium]